MRRIRVGRVKLACVKTLAQREREAAKRAKAVGCTLDEAKDWVAQLWQFRSWASMEAARLSS